MGPYELDIDVPDCKDERGCLKTREDLRLNGDDNIFVVGDMARFVDSQTGKPLPQLAQVATKQGPAAAENIRKLVNGESRSLQRFTYHHQGVLVSLGQWKAAGKVKGVTVTGPVAWFIWRTVYLFKLLSFRKKVRVAVEWTLNLFSPRDTTRIRKLHTGE